MLKGGTVMVEAKDGSVLSTGATTTEVSLLSVGLAEVSVVIVIAPEGAVMPVIPSTS
jgi:hypothetical protein